MSDYEFSLVRWPFDVQGSDRTFTFDNGTSTNAQSVTAGIYINSGDEVVVAPKDFLKAFADAVSAALTALGMYSIPGTVRIIMDPQGHVMLLVTNTGGGAQLTIVSPTANQRMWLGMQAAGDPTFSVAPTSGNPRQIFDFQAGCMWYPGIDQNYDSANEARDIVHEDRGVDGSVRRLVLSVNEWNERVIVWDRVPGARMKDSRAIVQAFCDVAEVDLNEDNTWENMWRYLKGEVGPYGDNRVYIYSSQMTAISLSFYPEYTEAAVRNGPYDVILSQSRPGLLGIDAESYVQGLASEFFPVKIALMEIV